MRIENTEINGIIVVAVDGKLDTGTATELEEHLDDLLANGKIKIILDFLDLDFIASTGLRVILSTGKKLKPLKGEIKICSLNDTVEDIFNMSGFNSIFKLFDSQENALQDF